MGVGGSAKTREFNLNAKRLREMPRESFINSKKPPRKTANRSNNCQKSPTAKRIRRYGIDNYVICSSSSPPSYSSSITANTVIQNLDFNCDYLNTCDELRIYVAAGISYVHLTDAHSRNADYLTAYPVTCTHAGPSFSGSMLD